VCAAAGGGRFPSPLAAVAQKRSFFASNAA
jgi:hypothetical protein